MRIRLATCDDLPALMALMRRVVPLMRLAGNLQWDENYPNEAVFQRDIDLGQLWVADAETCNRRTGRDHDGPGARLCAGGLGHR